MTVEMCSGHVTGRSDPGRWDNNTTYYNNCTAEIPVVIFLNTTSNVEVVTGGRNLILNGLMSDENTVLCGCLPYKLVSHQGCNWL